jgi:hypothetical protein
MTFFFPTYAATTEPSSTEKMETGPAQKKKQIQM